MYFQPVTAPVPASRRPNRLLRRYRLCLLVVGVGALPGRFLDVAINRKRSSAPAAAPFR